MQTTSIAISKWDIPTIKTVALTLREALKGRGIEVPGKRRFLDIIAKGLGHKSFSAVEVRSEGTKTDSRRFPHTLVEHSQSLIVAMVKDIPGIDGATERKLNEVVRSASGLDRELVHHLTIHVSDEYYWSDEYGFFFSEKPIDVGWDDQVDNFDVLQVSLVTEGLPMPFCDFVLLLEDFDIAGFLLYGWSEENHGQQFGIPDRLVVSSEVVSAVDGLDSFCKSLGVNLEVVDDSNAIHRKIRANCARSATHKFGCVLGHRELDEVGAMYNAGLEHHFYLEHTYSYVEIARLDFLRDRAKRPLSELRKKWNEWMEWSIEADDTVGEFSDYVRSNQKSPKVRDTLLFQSPIGGAQVLGTRYLIDCINSYRTPESIDGITSLIGLQERVMRSWPGPLVELEKQQKIIVEKGLSNSQMWLFNAWYFGILEVGRESKPIGIRESRAFVIRDETDIVGIAGWVVSNDCDGVLIELGASEVIKNSDWVALLPTNWLAGPAMYLLLEKKLLENWKKQVIPPRWLYWGQQNIDASEVLELLDRGMTKNEQYGCSYRLWWDLAYWNEPLVELRRRFECLFVSEYVGKGEECPWKDRVLATITRQTRLLFEWIPWPINKTTARDWVCQLWEFGDFKGLLETMDSERANEDTRLLRVSNKRVDEKYSTEMENVLLNISDDLASQNPFSSRIRREGARMIVRAMLELEPGKGLLVKTESGDWIYQAPSAWRDADEILDKWADAKNWQDHLGVLEELMEQYPTYPTIPAVAAWILMDHENLEEADVLSKKAYDLCVNSVPKDFEMDREEVNWGFVQNRDFHRALYCRAAVLDKLGYDRDAKKLYRSLLLMNPSDNLGVRDLVSKNVAKEARQRANEYRARELEKLAEMNGCAVEEIEKARALATLEMNTPNTGEDLPGGDDTIH